MVNGRVSFFSKVGWIVLILMRMCGNISVEVVSRVYVNRVLGMCLCRCVRVRVIIVEDIRLLSIVVSNRFLCELIRWMVR